MEKKLENLDIYTMKAADHFGIELNEVENKHRRFIKEQEFAMNYGHRGPLPKTYSLSEEGTVEFDQVTSESLVAAAGWLPPY